MCWAELIAGHIPDLEPLLYNQHNLELVQHTNKCTQTYTHTYKTFPGVGYGRHVDWASLHSVNEASLGHCDSTNDVHPPVHNTQASVYSEIYNM